MAQRSGDKYAAILDAAQIVIARQGYEKAQISRIAAEAGVAAGTVYLYFQNKQDLLVSLFRDRMGIMMFRARASLAEVQDPKEKLRRFVAYHLQWLARDRDLSVVTQIELRQADSGVRGQITQIMHGYFEVIDEIIIEGQQQGVFRALDPRQIRNLVFGTLDQTVTAWVMSGFRFDLEAQAEPTFMLVTGGVFEANQVASTSNGHPGAA